MGVFWKADWRFYDWTVTNYNTGTGRHDISYDDGELENLSLSSEKVIWKLPPGVNSKGKSQDAGRFQGKRANTQRKRPQQPRSKKTAAVDDPVEVRTALAVELRLQRLSTVQLCRVCRLAALRRTMASRILGGQI